MSHTAQNIHHIYVTMRHYEYLMVPYDSYDMSYIVNHMNQMICYLSKMVYYIVCTSYSDRYLIDNDELNLLCIRFKSALNRRNKVMNSISGFDFVFNK